eukprot:m.54243 g.54243  ORF g.54243 m.54243 type:complete len:237 (+) comp6833_c0_seq1:419-1129(+)
MTAHSSSSIKRSSACGGCHWQAQSLFLGALLVALTCAKPLDLSAFPDSAESIYVTNQGVTSIPRGIFARFTNLQELSLASNQLTSIESGIFSDLGNTLTSLDLSYNRLTSISDTGFRGLASLNVLSLSRNNLTSIGSRAFCDSNELVFMELIENQLTRIESGTFSCLPKLSGLALNLIALHTLRAVPFTALPTLVNCTSLTTCSQASRVLLASRLPCCSSPTTSSRASTKPWPKSM